MLGQHCLKQQIISKGIAQKQEMKNVQKSAHFSG